MNSDNAYKGNDNTAQGKGDVLRAKDIISPYPDNQSQQSESEKTTNHKNPIPIKTIDSRNFSATAKGEEQNTTAIPHFDLADEIMAEHRKLTAVKRKAPGKNNAAQKTKAKVVQGKYYTESPPPSSLYNRQIIAEIVARDIEKLYHFGH